MTKRWIALAALAAVALVASAVPASGTTDVAERGTKTVHGRRRLLLADT